MRGLEKNTDALFVYVSPESFVPSDHPLRLIRIMADKALDALSGELNRMYSHTGRPSMPPEVLLKALLSKERFSVDGTLIEAWASIKSFHPKGDDPPRSSGRAEVILEDCMGYGLCEGVCTIGVITTRLEPSKGGILDLEELKKLSA